MEGRKSSTNDPMGISDGVIDLYVSNRDPKPEIMLMLNTLGAEGWEAVTSGEAEGVATFSRDQFQSSLLPEIAGQELLEL